MKRRFIQNCKVLEVPYEERLSVHNQGKILEILDFRTSRHVEDRAEHDKIKCYNADVHFFNCGQMLLVAGGFLGTPFGLLGLVHVDNIYSHFDSSWEVGCI